MKYVCFVLILAGFSIAWAVEKSQNNLSSQQWTYAGSKDEEDLVVQTELVPPVEKVDRETQAETIRNNLFKKNNKQSDKNE